MKSLRHACTVSILMLLLIPGIFLSAAPSAGRVEAESRIDWSEGWFILEASYILGENTRPSPGIRQQALNAIREELPSIFIREISSLKIDSRTTVRDRIAASPSITRAIREQVSARFSEDFSRFDLIFRYRLFPDIADSFISHLEAARQTPELEYVPSGSYSGIVIFAEGPLPVYGTRRAAELQPALFPKIFDADMELIFEEHFVDPEWIRRWGPLGYFEADDMGRVYSRVGEVPLFVHATGLFGMHSTDILVSRRSGRQLRADEHILSLLREGKIAVVYSSVPAMTADNR
ncbi:MAG: hypothetical protein ACP5IA_09430 [Sediminispirochaetaceae bacterium]